MNFAKKTVEWLGYKFLKEAIVATIQNSAQYWKMKKPKSLKDPSSFMGAGNFLSFYS